MRARRAGQGERWRRELICVSTPEEPSGRMPRPEERSPHLRGRLGTLRDLLPTWRGHAIIEVDGTWVYADTGEPVRDHIDRPCGRCGLPNTLEGHDGCVGTIPGAMAACCGHGHDEGAYVLYEDRTRIAGRVALTVIDGRRRSA